MGRWRIDASGRSRWSSSSRQGGGREAGGRREGGEQTHHLQATRAYKGQQVLQPLGALKGSVRQLPASVGQKGGCTPCERGSTLSGRSKAATWRPASRARAVSSHCAEQVLSQRRATEGWSV